MLAFLNNNLTEKNEMNTAAWLNKRRYLSVLSLPNKERPETLRRVAIAYPSGNTTAVIFDQLLSNNRKMLNDDIMQTWKITNSDRPEVEQCCFVTLPSSPEAVGRVEMFGGEFCGNATRSAIWLITKGQDYEGKIEVSGVEKPLAFRVLDGDVSVEMPLPENKILVQSVAEGSLVQLDGISQFVVTSPENGQTPRQMLTDLLTPNKYDLCNQPAVGVSYYDRTSRRAEFCVWVKEVDTIFDETACGSGTSAIGIATATETEQSVDLDVVQPSGEVIRTQAAYAEDQVTESFIAGKVDILYDGEYKLI